MRAPLVVEAKDNAGNFVPYASVRVRRRAKGGDADIFKDEFGPEEYSNPAVTDASGRIVMWVERGAYICYIGGPGITTYTLPMDAVPAGDGEVDSGWLSSGITTYSISSDTAEFVTGSSSFGYAPTPDIISNVVIPDNGLCKIGFVFSTISAGGFGFAAFFLNETQLTSPSSNPITPGHSAALGNDPTGSEINTVSVLTGGAALSIGGVNQGIVTTGQTMLTPGGAVGQGFSHFFVERGGTFNFSARYKAAVTGTTQITHRRIWLGVYAL